MKAPQYNEDFGQFWSQYPRKTGKGAAWASWQKTSPPLAGVVQALAWQRTSRDWLKDSGAFVPMPATYLNQRRWEDEPPTRARPPAPSQDRLPAWMNEPRPAPWPKAPERTPSDDTLTPPDWMGMDEKLAAAKGTG